jgi:mRNA-degrading endonuclease toxin of MazEF toxin-antitoxin module
VPPGLRVKGVILVHQTKSFDWRARRARHAGTVSDEIVSLAAEIIKDIIEG